jgi:plasmid fertility inhibition factor
MAVSLITIEKRYGTTTMAIFSVPLADREQVFMSVAETPYENENRGVVIVDAQKFLRLWRADPYKEHQEIAEGTPATWREDYKFKYAVDGFSKGFANPVPLSEVEYDEVNIRSVTYTFLRFGRKEHIRRARFVSFINGITRTIWLLSHGCRAFPVECRMSSAHQLHRAAAVAGTRVFTVRDVKGGLIPVNHEPPYN